MADRNLLPIQSLLNQSPAVRPRTPYSQRSDSELSSPASDTIDASVPDGRSAGAGKKVRDSTDLSYSVPQGPIKYPPYEDLNADQLGMVSAFNIRSLGQIGQWCAHISYSSDKKDVYAKTGRESFHVFAYKFTDPSDRQSYDVMWDYVGGFVRISPFFKCRKHKKTGPAKMLDLNKGLRDVTFHMTGGNRIAQGYWVPFHCARAVCATFCYPIAGALIPIFGPTFPQECISPESPRFNRMAIDERIIREAKHDIIAYRHSSLTVCPRNNEITSHPRRNHHSVDSMRHGPLPVPSCEPYIPHDNRNGFDQGSHYRSSPPTQNIPWIHEAENDRYGFARPPYPPLAPLNPMMRHEPLQPIHLGLRPDSYQTPSNFGPPAPMYKRGLPLDPELKPHQPEGGQTYDGVEVPYKRLRLETQLQDPIEYSAPGRPCQTPPDLPNVSPYLPWSPAETSTAHPSPEPNNYGQEPKEGMEAKKLVVGEPKYTTEELRAALILSNIVQPLVGPEKKPQKAAGPENKPGSRAKSI